MMIWSQPAASASSTPYWIIGLSTSGSISLGWALVAGKKRVPNPAAGKTALRTLIFIDYVLIVFYGIYGIFSVDPLEIQLAESTMHKRFASGHDCRCFLIVECIGLLNSETVILKM